MKLIKSLALCSVALLAGCTTVPWSNPEVNLVGFGFINQTGSPMRNIELRMNESLTVASSSYIAPKGHFGSRIPDRMFSAKMGTVKWTEGTHPETTATFEAALPNEPSDLPMVGILHLQKAGIVTFEFVTLAEVQRHYNLFIKKNSLKK